MRLLYSLLACGLLALCLAADPSERIYSTIPLQKLTDATSSVSTSTPTLASSLTLSTNRLSRCNVLIAPRLSVSGATVSFKVLYWSANGDFETTSEIFTVTAGTELVASSYHAPSILVDSLGAAAISIQITTAASSGTATFYGKAY